MFGKKLGGEVEQPLNLKVIYIFFKESLHFYWVWQNRQHHHHGEKKPQQTTKSNGNLSIARKNYLFKS